MLRKHKKTLASLLIITMVSTNMSSAFATTEIPLNEKSINNTISNSVITEAESFNLISKRLYKQVIGANKNELLDVNNKYIASHIEKMNANGNLAWESMIKSNTTDRTKIWADLSGGPGDVSKSGNYTTIAKRLLDLTVAYATNGTDLYKNESVKDEVIKAIDWLIEKGWYGKTCPASNWWDKQIGVPINILRCMIVLEDDIEARNLEVKFLTAMKDQKATLLESWRGSANLMDSSLNAVFVAALEEDSSYIDNIKSETEKILYKYVTTGNGFYEDGSYVDHTMYAYTGGYGGVFLTAYSMVMGILNDTAFEITYEDNRQRFYDKIVFDGFEPLLPDGLMVDMVSGRGITRSNGTDIVRGAATVGSLAIYVDLMEEGEDKVRLEQMVKEFIMQDPDTFFANQSKVNRLFKSLEIFQDETIIPRGELLLHKRYNAMDKVMHSRDGYSFGLSMHSDRIANNETGNKEGYKLWNTSDGATTIHNSDREQYSGNYWPTVNHLRLAGTTVENAFSRSPSTGMKMKNPNTWVGGTDMSNLYGVSGIELTGLGNNGAKDGVHSKKSYFMFDDEIVAVGSDITSTTGNTIETIVENRLTRDTFEGLFVNGKDYSTEITDDGPESELSTDKSYLILDALTTGVSTDYQWIAKSIKETDQNVTVNLTFRIPDATTAINSSIDFWGAKTPEYDIQQDTVLIDGISNQYIVREDVRVFEIIDRPNHDLANWNPVTGGKPNPEFIMKRPNNWEWLELSATFNVETEKVAMVITGEGKDLPYFTGERGFAGSDIRDIDYLTEVRFKLSDKFDSRIDVKKLGIDYSDVNIADEYYDFGALTIEEMTTDTANWTMPTSKRVSATIQPVEVGINKGTTIDNVTWAHFEDSEKGSDIGYYFPEPTSLKALIEPRTHEWTEINGLWASGIAMGKVTETYATLLFDHGQNPVNDTYQYVLLPNKSQAETLAYTKNPNISVIALTEDLHAVSENELSIIGMNFWNDKVLECEGITVNKKASVMTQDTDETFELSISDPTQKNIDGIEVIIAKQDIGSVLIKDDRIEVVESGDTIKLSIDTNGSLGKSMKIKFAKTGYDGGSSGGGSSSGGNTTKPETSKNPDGSTSETETDKKTGEVTITTKYPNGNTIIQVIDKYGNEKINVSGIKEENSTIVIKTDKDLSFGHVAVILHADGTKEIIKDSVLDENGMRITLDENADIQIIDNSKSFSDISEDAWYYDSVNFATARELFNGISENEFAPNESTTRAMLWTVLYRYSDETVSSNDTNWYSESQKWAQDKNISDGMNPDGNITREQIVTSLYRLSGSPDVTTTITDSYSDNSQISDYSITAMNWAINEGILTGKSSAILDPKSNASRAEVSAILMRYISK